MATTQEPAKKKTKQQLIKEKMLREKRKGSSEAIERGRIMKQAAKKMGKAKLSQRALKAWKTRRKLYGENGIAGK